MSKTGRQNGGAKRTGLLARVKELTRSSVKSRQGSATAPLLDVLVFVIALLFSRCHIIFGSHPLAIAWLAVLPSRVWLALVGACVGSISLGRSGIIYLISSVAVVLLRLIVSRADGRGASPEKPRGYFGEGLALRVGTALIGGFVSAVLEVVASGFSFSSVLFGLSMILLPALVCFALSGLFDTGIGFTDVFVSKAPLFSADSEKGRLPSVFFAGSCLMLIFLISFSLKEVEVFGITFSYIFAGGVTLLAAKRFGSVRAGAVGFAATVALSPSYSVAYALGGLAAGALFKLGFAYALIGSAGAVAAWGAYSGGLMGFLSTFPEFAISSMLTSPIIAKLQKEEDGDKRSAAHEVSAKDMVGTMALAYKTDYSGSLDGLEASLMRLSEILRKSGEGDVLPCLEELADLVTECADVHCASCKNECFCTSEIRKHTRQIAEKIKARGTVDAEELRLLGAEGCSEELARAISRAVGSLTEQRYKVLSKNTRAEDFELTSRLISEARLADEEEKSIDTATTAAAEGAMAEFGLSSGAVMVFGKRRRHVMVAVPDEGGDKVGSKEFKEKLAAVVGARLGEASYYKRGNLSMMECSSDEAFSAEISTLSRDGSQYEVSGDTAKHFKSRDGRFISVISDGMGSGDNARDTSRFVTDFISDALEHGAPRETVVCMLNNAVKRRAGECTATLDFCSVDLYSGECIFLKCGAPPSYIKRGPSIFRIRARSAPLGVLKVTDAERIRAELRDGDFVISFSDGILPSGDDEPWLLELLGGHLPDSAEEIARTVMDTAVRLSGSRDDMTVSVVKISAL